MLIGILSDIQDNLQNLEQALAELSRRQVATLIFCGDFCSPIAARALETNSAEIFDALNAVFAEHSPHSVRFEAEGMDPQRNKERRSLRCKRHFLAFTRGRGW